MDCFVASAPRNDGGYSFAFSRRVAPEACLNSYALLDSEGAGNAGRALHPPSHAQCAPTQRARVYRAAENIRHSLRNGFTAYSVLSPENGCFASVAPRETVASGCIDASTATSGPHAFAVRFSRARLSQLPRPPHPRPSLRRWPTPLVSRKSGRMCERA